MLTSILFKLSYNRCFCGESCLIASSRSWKSSYEMLLFKLALLISFFNNLGSKVEFSLSLSVTFDVLKPL